MNFIEFLNGHFTLFDANNKQICDLGNTITMLVRKGKVHKDCLGYIVEIKESLIHNREPVSKNNIAEFVVDQEGHDARTCMSVLNRDAMGKEHRFSCKTYDGGFALVIDGLLWDGKILHVRDLV